MTTRSRRSHGLSLVQPRRMAKENSAEMRPTFEARTEPDSPRDENQSSMVSMLIDSSGSCSRPRANSPRYWRRLLMYAGRQPDAFLASRSRRIAAPRRGPTKRPLRPTGRRNGCRTPRANTEGRSRPPLAECCRCPCDSIFRAPTGSRDRVVESRGFEPLTPTMPLGGSSPSWGSPLTPWSAPAFDDRKRGSVTACGLAFWAPRKGSGKKNTLGDVLLNQTLKVIRESTDPRSQLSDPSVHSLGHFLRERNAPTDSTPISLAFHRTRPGRSAGGNCSP